MGLFQHAYEMTGGTPLLRLSNIERELGLSCRLYAKVEFFNPTGSVKDRAALHMVLDAEEKGLIKPGATLIEPTSGNTGIGLASVAASKGYRCIIVMPDTMSVERQRLIKAYGAEIVLTPGKEGMAGAVKKAEELLKEIPGSFLPNQFGNQANAKAHYETTGPEIVGELGGAVDFFVAGIGTGGTITGTGKFLKEKLPAVTIVGVEPASSPLLTKGVAGKHAIQGIGANFVPEVLDRSIVDEILPIEDQEAIDCAKLVGTKEGILVGISSGAALAAAIKLAKREQGKYIVLVFPDSADRYYSTALFQD